MPAHTNIHQRKTPYSAAAEKRLAGRVISVSVGTSKDDIIGYLRVRLDEDKTPDTMDESLVLDILEKIPQNMLEMYVGAMILESRQTLSADSMHLVFYWIP